MTEDEQRKKGLDLKAESRVYTGYDDEECLARGTAQAVLAKYDQVINGVQGTGFRMDGRPLRKAARPNREAWPRKGCFCRLIMTVCVLLSLHQTRIDHGFAENLAFVDYIQGNFEFKKITVQYTYSVAIFQLTNFSFQ